MTVDLEHFQPSFGTAVHLNVRCLVGLHGSVPDDDLDEAFSAALEDAGDELDLLHYALGADETDRVQFLVGSQSLKPNASQVTLITLYESDESQPSHLVKQSFVHPNGEVIGLVALAARPDWFVSVYSTYSADRPELRTGARVWRLPPATLADGLSASPPNTVSVGLNDAVSEPANSSSSALEYVTTLPLDRYCGIRKIVSHPSTSCADLACVVGPPVDTSLYATSHLVILQAPSKSGSGDYQVACSAQLCLPPSSQVFTSYLKTNLSHLFKTLHSNGQVAVTSPPNAVRWSSYQQAGQLAVAFESGVLGWDVRSMKPCFWLEAAHWPCVRDLDFNPHRPNLLATGGDDGCIRLWDLRYLKSKLCPTNRPESFRSSDTTKWFPGMFDSSESSTEPLYSVQAHSHWVCFYLLVKTLIVFLYKYTVVSSIASSSFTCIKWLICI
ncbi:uncharacterized protein DEA37_0001655 [Paragonimus westermani]|uniref:Uncharacterized protein n=1 Tax=Paragonimus westermani TaxID=34504 RepID=A0A5J4N789_9TREM|nr:uncharacterized protein DEA37_0001655 [Paragonimus westermani]